uniref:Uncharacterized protein n=1 Tax=Rhizophagus irregularis (strain DAOM 181602 / DAOM 197198 / MUCL 43194) TaxID=747089 RepID=U9T290_RHIID
MNLISGELDPCCVFPLTEILTVGVVDHSALFQVHTVRLNQITSLNLLKKQVVELEDIYIYISENIKTFVKCAKKSESKHSMSLTPYLHSLPVGSIMLVRITYNVGRHYRSHDTNNIPN